MTWYITIYCNGNDIVTCMESVNGKYITIQCKQKMFLCNVMVKL